LANGGKLVKPYIVDEIIHADGTKNKTQPRTLRKVISERASSLITGMLVSVVKNGHGHRAAVPGYLVAGKTGTAQIPKIGGGGYEENETIGTFAGYAPVTNPRFVLITRIDRPKDVEFAESSAAPLFGEIAAFALKYLEVPPDDVR
jgi:cell division protein FtsI/penicillin-binding protein 2